MKTYCTLSYSILPTYARVWTMHFPALAGYFRTLRETLQGRPSQQDIADQIGMGVNSVRAWEKGSSCPCVEHAAWYIEAVQGSPDQLHQLMINRRASYEDGERYALIWRVVQTSRPTLDNPEVLARLLGQLSPAAAAEVLPLLQRL